MDGDGQAGCFQGTADSGGGLSCSTAFVRAASLCPRSGSAWHVRVSQACLVRAQ